MGSRLFHSRSPERKTMICRCQHCKNELEFDEQYAGQAVECPHCKIETELNATEQPNAPPPEPKKPTVRRMKEKIAVETGEGSTFHFAPYIPSTPAPPPESKDGTLGTVSGLFLLLAVIGGIIGVVCFVSYIDGEHPGNATWAIAGFAVMIQGYVASVVFEAFAEILMRLKYLSVQHFTGTAKEVLVETVYSCGKCRATVHLDQPECKKCGAELV
jgi:hypothetical protein